MLDRERRRESQWAVITSEKRETVIFGNRMNKGADKQRWGIRFIATTDEDDVLKIGLLIESVQQSAKEFIRRKD